SGRVLCEVACQHRCCRHEAEEVGWRLAEPWTLITPEEEQTGVGDRASERAAELVAIEAVVLPFPGGRVDEVERVGRVETLVADKLAEITVKQVVARLGYDVDRGARVHAVVRRRGARLESELLECVGERKREVEVVVRVVMSGAVEQISHTDGRSAGNGNGSAALHAPARFAYR